VRELEALSSTLGAQPMSGHDQPLAVRAAALKKHFPIRLGMGKKPVLQGIDLSISQGSTRGLVGPNGSGKSTLLRILAGVERASSGTLQVLTGSIESSSVRSRIAFVPEDAPFPPELSARAALVLIGSLHGMTRAQVRERSPELLARVGLAQHAEKPLGRFSKGMGRRFALAQAWLHEPELVLLDEPTAGLDAEGFDVLAELLAEARQTGTTVILASHLVSDLHEHCDEVSVLMEGRFVASAPPTDLFSSPGCWRVEAEHLDEAQLARLQKWIEAEGGQVREIRPAGKSLFDLYHETQKQRGN
jgi:ABC-type multidrug transport system ATPase subunit